ncbi:MAG: hypothetical protein [Bacteriophage sp.]|nr:MAG: hypothetical protein [Bacteriophage sp.]
MTRKLYDVPIKRIAAEHYLFDLGQSVEKTAEILDMDEDRVREIYDNYMRSFILARGNK